MLIRIRYLRLIDTYHWEQDCPLFDVERIITYCHLLVTDSLLFYRVDKLYAFFIQWKSEVYDSDDKIAELGFIALTDEQIDENEANDPTPGESPRVRKQLGRQVTLDWEVRI